MSAPFQRPERNEYYMRLAFAVRERANCKGSRVGAVLVLEDRVISTGYNGTPQGMPNCEDDDGCVRCAKREHFGSGNAYDVWAGPSTRTTPSTSPEAPPRAPPPPWPPAR